MSPLAARGRSILLVLFTIIAFDRLSALTLTWYAHGWEHVGFRKLLHVAAVLGCGWWLWMSGDRTLRWLFAGLCAIAAYRELVTQAAIGFMLFKLGQAIDRPVIDSIVSIIAAFGPLLVYGLTYLITAWAVLRFASVRAFLAWQQQEAHWEQVPVSDVSGFLASYRARPQYESLTQDLLRSLSDERLIEVIDDHAMLMSSLHDCNREDLPVPVHTVAVIRHLHREDGGLPEYFEYTSGREVFQTRDAYQRIGADEHADLMTRAIGVFLSEEPDPNEHTPERLETLVTKHLADRATPSLPEFDAELQASGCPDDLLLSYVKAHIADFATE